VIAVGSCEDKLQLLFMMYDRDHSGSLSRAEVSEMIRYCHFMDKNICHCIYGKVHLFVLLCGQDLSDNHAAVIVNLKILCKLQKLFVCTNEIML